ncbi:MAG: prenyltransferase [Candidatus Omnitrophota bacterium]
MVKSIARNAARALRLPFIGTSILPFVLGSLAAPVRFCAWGFILGLAAVIGTHLGANMINDYADSCSGADWQDRKFYGFFGGSKLIQEGILGERFYLAAAIFCFLAAGVAVLGLSTLLKTDLPVICYLLILAAGVSYSYGPLRFSYCRLGEITIFILFGPALVMGGYFIQSGVFPDIRSLVLSLPAGFLTTAILFANEVPDYPEDTRCDKFTWVTMTGPRHSYILYAFIMLAAFLSVLLAIFLGYLHRTAYLAFIFIPMVFKATVILKRSFTDKGKLIKSSRLTILVHSFVNASLIIGSLI